MPYRSEHAPPLDVVPLLAPLVPLVPLEVPGGRPLDPVPAQRNDVHGGEQHSLSLLQLAPAEKHAGGVTRTSTDASLSRAPGSPQIPARQI